MPSYNLRNVDATLWDGFKAQCEREGRSMRFVIEQLFLEYAKHGYDVMIQELRDTPVPTATKAAK